jgi:membrane protein
LWLDGLIPPLPPPIRAVVERARHEDILLYSASLAFYALVSLVPTITLVLWVTSLILGDQRVQDVARQIERLAPKNLALDKALQTIADQGTGLGVAAFVAGLWPATAYGAGLRRAFDQLSPKKPKEMRGLRGRALLFVVLLPVFVLGSLIASYAGSQALGHSTVGKVIGWGVALLTGFAGAAVSLVLIFRLFPPQPLSWRAIARGTAVTASGAAVLSVLLGLYLTVGANFERHYASSGLATVVLLGVWLFLTNVMVLVGYTFARET